MSMVVGKLEPVAVIRRDPLRFGSGSGLVLAFEVGVEDLRGALVDANGETFCNRAADADPTQLSGAPPHLLNRLKRLAKEILKAGFRFVDADGTKLIDEDGCLPLLGATVAWPAPVGRDGFAHGHAFVDKQWHSVPLTQRVGATLRGPFEDLRRVDGINAANAAVMAVVFDRTRSRAGEPETAHSQIAMVVRLQGGISAGTMQIARHRPGQPLAFIKSRLIVGTNGFAGELGHLPISSSIRESINADRPRRLAEISDWGCTCPQRGHLEGLASVRALMQRLRDSSGYEIEDDAPMGPQITKLLKNPDEVLARALHDIGRLIGGALASPILMLDPASITLSGYLALDAVVEGVRREKHTWSTGVSNSVTIDRLEGTTNDLVEMRGAALAMFRRQLYRDMSKLTDPDKRERLVVQLPPAYLRELD